MGGACSSAGSGEVAGRRSRAGAWVPVRFGRVLVALDGSRLAETALPAAAAFAARFGAPVTVVHVVEPGGPATVHGDRHLREAGEAERYLAEVVGWLAARGVAARALVRAAEGEVAAAVVAVARAEGADLVVLCSHGGRGVRGLLFGRVPQQVLARGGIPVLLVRASARGRAEPFDCRRLLVPLDGTAEGEAALRVALGVAGAFGAAVVLVRVVPTLGALAGALVEERAPAARLLPTATAALLELEAVEAGRYLDRVRAALEEQGVRAEPVVARGDPAAEVLRVAAERGVDLLVAATHGRAGVAAVWAGSVVAQMVERTRWPMLLVRVP